MPGIQKKLNVWKHRTRIWAYDHVLPYYDRRMANRSIRRLQRRTPENGCPIKVGFVVQMPELWNKQAPVYEEMVRDPRFDPWLIVVPSFNLATRRREGYGAELAYFHKSYPNGQILTSAELGEDFSGMQSCGFHYVFLSRCWESYVPNALRTRRIIRYAKTCYIPYAYHSFEDDLSYYNTRFFYSLSILFCCSKTQMKQYSPTGNRKSVLLGFPPLSNLQTAEIPDYRRLRIVWTPRWTNDPQYGGTSFLDYKDNFTELKKNSPELSILLRPHPLTFEFMVQSGNMSEEEVRQYKAKNEGAGVHFDQNASFEDTLQCVDAIISDFSSIIIEAVLCGKIIIFCGKTPKEKPSDVLLEILQCSYRCKNWQEILETIRNLQAGNDPLAASRRKLAAKLHQLHANSPAKIAEYLYHDRLC